MKSEKVRHILISFLYFLQIRFCSCESQTRDVNSPPYNKYAFATSYAWKFRFPVPYSVGAQDGTAQWRPNVRYSQEQIQLPNEYLIGSNYPGRYVKNQNPTPQAVSPNILNVQVPSAQRQQFIQQPSTSQQAQTFVPQPQLDQLLLFPIQQPTQLQAQQGVAAQQQPTFKIPLFNEQGQQTGWQFFPFSTEPQQVQRVPFTEQPTQPYYYVPQPPTSRLPGDQPIWQYQQFTPVPIQTQQPLGYIPLSSQGQQFETTPFSQQPVPGTNISQQGCFQQLGATVCPPISSIASSTTDSSFSSDSQSQEINRLLQSYQQNLLQVLLSLMQQPTLRGTPGSADSKSPVAIAGATISDDPTGTSHLNSFTYTNT